VRALVKLEQVLPSHLRRRVRALQTSTLTLAPGGPGGPQVDPQHLTVVAAACRDRERLRFAYVARDQTQSRREVEPDSLVNVGRRWYLVAWDCGRTDWRTFRLDRVTKPASTGVRFTPRALPAKDAAAYVAQSLKSAPARYEARVTVHAPAAAVRGRRWGGATVEPIDDQRCTFRTGDDNLDWLAMRVAMLEWEYEVHEPPELVERLRALGGRIARAVASGQ
jgi:predicted DNA-binding transcriptional regulator YafY